MWNSLIHLSRCTSTQEWAIAHTMDGHSPATGMVMCDKQTSGRGQRGSRWHSVPHASLCATYWMRVPQKKRLPMPWLSIAVGLAMHQTIAEWQIPNLSLKWPNDLYCKGAKLGGLLIEIKQNASRVRYAYMGLGLNVNQTPLSAPRGISMQEASGHLWDLDEIHASLSHTLGIYIQQWQTGHADTLRRFRQSYEQVLYGRNQWRHYTTSTNTAFEAQLLGIDTHARLRVKPKGQAEQRFLASQIKQTLD